VQPFFESNVDGHGATTVVGLHQESPYYFFHFFVFVLFTLVAKKVEKV